jgi:hypothetical protein
MTLNSKTQNYRPISGTIIGAICGIIAGILLLVTPIYIYGSTWGSFTDWLPILTYIGMFLGVWLGAVIGFIIGYGRREQSAAPWIGAGIGSVIFLLSLVLSAVAQGPLIACIGLACIPIGAFIGLILGFLLGYTEQESIEQVQVQSDISKPSEGDAIK